MAPHRSSHGGSRMKLSVSLIAAAAVLAITGLAQAAGKISSPAIFGGSGNSQAFCAVHSVGKTTTTVELTVLDESGSALTPFVQSCNGQFSANRERLRPCATECVLD